MAHATRLLGLLRARYQGKDFDIEESADGEHTDVVLIVSEDREEDSPEVQAGIFFAFAQGFSKALEE